MNSHEIETESIEVVLTSPVFDRINNELSDHWTLRGGFVAHSGAVGEFTSCSGSEEVARYELLLAKRARIPDVVVDDVHDHTDAIVVKRLNHGFQLGDSVSWFSRFRRV